MILEVAILNVRAGEGDAFEQAFSQAQNIISSMPGYVSHQRRQMKILCMIAVFAFPAFCSAADGIQSDIPIAVRSVMTQRVGKSLIRVIEYNTETTPKFSVELIKPPKMVLMQKLDIHEIHIDVEGNKKLLGFAKSSGVFITDVAIDKDVVKFKVEYFSAGHAGAYYLSSCMINLSDNRLTDPVCKLVSTEVKK